ncbi:hypothetical protein B0H21DRAFT_818207 [Amylocystis lapponica]|nr:hypothetical protein B0H21DRAFT_818207 [Amylocystis lapponica]
MGGGRTPPGLATDRGQGLARVCSKWARPKRKSQLASLIALISDRTCPRRISSAPHLPHAVLLCPFILKDCHSRPPPITPSSSPGPPFPFPADSPSNPPPAPRLYSIPPSPPIGPHSRVDPLLRFLRFPTDPACPSRGPPKVAGALCRPISFRPIPAHTAPPSSLPHIGPPMRTAHTAPAQSPSSPPARASPRTLTRGSAAPPLRPARSSPLALLALCSSPAILTAASKQFAILPFSAPAGDVRRPSDAMLENQRPRDLLRHNPTLCLLSLPPAPSPDSLDRPVMPPCPPPLPISAPPRHLHVHAAVQQPPSPCRVRR